MTYCNGRAQIKDNNNVTEGPDEIPYEMLQITCYTHSNSYFTLYERYRLFKC